MEIITHDYDAPPSIDWWVTNLCNLRCDFCYGPEHASDPVGMRWLIAESIAASETSTVTFCGGEPLVLGGKENLDLATLFQESGKLTVLNTNGQLVKSQFAPHLPDRKRLPYDLAGFSIEGPTDKLHQSMRGERARLGRTIESARWMAENGVAIKIATVLSNVNKEGILDLADLIRDEINPNIWRIYEYSQRGPINTGQKRHPLPRDEYEALVAMAADIVRPVVTSPSNTDTGKGCLIVDASGEVLMPSDDHPDGYEPLGNCLETPIDEIWSKHPSVQRVIENKFWTGDVLIDDTPTVDTSSIDGRAIHPTAHRHRLHKGQVKELDGLRKFLDYPEVLPAIRQACIDNLSLPESTPLGAREIYWQRMLRQARQCDPANTVTASSVVNRFTDYISWSGLLEEDKDLLLL
jgi:MoaA/NifB/PqqE/SkfB family radical SAM enzyme